MRYRAIILLVSAFFGTASFLIPESCAQTPPLTAMREGYASLPGVRIWYTDSGGRGIPIILLHAGTGSSAVWEHQTPTLVASGYRVIAYDRRGWGRSVIEGGPQPGAGADDLRGLLDHLGIPRCHLIGTAAGGMVALDFAVSFPQTVRSMVIANTSGAIQDKDYAEMGKRIQVAQLDDLPPDFRELSPSYRASNPEGTHRWLELERTSRPTGPVGQRQESRNRITFSDLNRIKVPLLLISGDADLYAPPALLRIFNQRVNGSELVILPDAAHSAYWEQPDMFNYRVLNFLNKH